MTIIASFLTIIIFMQIIICTYLAEIRNELKNKKKYTTMITDFNQIDTDTEEGKLLYAAIIKIKNEYQWKDGTTLILKQINDPSRTQYS